MNTTRDRKFDRAIMFYKRGMTLQQLAGLYNCTRQNMHEALKRRGVRFRPIGKVPKPQPPRLTREQKFWLNVDKGGVDQCWNWKASKLKSGYGHCWDGEKSDYSHRLAYIYAVGSIPEGMNIIHSCSNPSCCNPAHLKLGTPADRAHHRDAMGRNGSYKCRGENHLNARVTNIQVQQIRKLYAVEDVTQAKLSRQLGISYSIIWSVIHRRSWNWLPDDSMTPSTISGESTSADEAGIAENHGCRTA